MRDALAAPRHPEAKPKDLPVFARVLVLTLCLTNLTSCRLIFTDHSDLSLQGGRDAAKSDFQGALAIVIYDQHTKRKKMLCSGTLVLPQIIMTAAHCVSSIERGSLSELFLKGQEIGIFWGNDFEKDDLSKTFKVVAVEKVYIHPSWVERLSTGSGGSSYNQEKEGLSDVAFVKINKSIESPNFKPAKLELNSYVKVNHQVRLVGFGLLSEDKNPEQEVSGVTGSSESLPIDLAIPIGTKWTETSLENLPLRFQAERGTIGEVGKVTYKLFLENNKALLMPGDSGGPVYVGKRAPFNTVVAINAFRASKYYFGPTDHMGVTRLDASNESSDWVSEVISGRLDKDPDYFSSEKNLFPYTIACKFEKQFSLETVANIGVGSLIKQMQSKLELKTDKKKIIFKRDFFNTDSYHYFPEGKDVSNAPYALNFERIDRYNGVIYGELYTRQGKDLKLAINGKCIKDRK